jgi:hypothetical protein
MKLYQIEHINEEHNKNRVMGMELKFTHSICSTSGQLWEAEKQPDDWDHVKRLTHMLFLAWNDKNPIEGVVYLGELVSKKSEHEDFYNFFREFNGFSINEDQKYMHKYFVDKQDGFVKLPRRTGKTIYSTTLAVWLQKQGKNVHYVTHNHETSKLVKRSLLSRAYMYPTYWMPTIEEVYSSDRLRRRKIDWFICDEIFLYDKKTWNALKDYTDTVKTCKQFGAYTGL